jgi:hypothetical protein
MLRRQWTPALIAALHAVDIELEERERDDVLRAVRTNAEEPAR